VRGLVIDGELVSTSSEGAQFTGAFHHPGSPRLLQRFARCIVHGLPDGGRAAWATRLPHNVEMIMPHDGGLGTISTHHRLPWGGGGLRGGRLPQVGGSYRRSRKLGMLGGGGACSESTNRRWRPSG